MTNLCTALEGCGRFLLRSEATSEKMMGVLEIVKRKIKVDATLGVRQVTELENAYYQVSNILCPARLPLQTDKLIFEMQQCDPPDRPLVVAKVRTPMQLYIRQLFYLTLTRNSVDKVLKLTRKLHWEDKSVRCVRTVFVGTNSDSSCACYRLSRSCIARSRRCGRSSTATCIYSRFCCTI